MLRCRRHVSGTRWPAVALASGAALLAAGATWWWLRPADAPAPVQVLRQVTNSGGLNDYPALSRDGNLLAFASDRSEAGNLDIWSQQVGGREPIRLTSDDADDSDPAISADGTRVAFRSERAGGGIYVVPSLGGDAVLLAPRGRGPRFSPDGHWIAYWEGRESSDLLPGTARVFVIESGGGQARQIGADLGAALYPVWSPGSDEVIGAGPPCGRGRGLVHAPLAGRSGAKNGGLRGTGRAAVGIHRMADRHPAARMECGGPRRVCRRPGRLRQSLGNRALRRTRAGPRHTPDAGSGISIARLIGGGQRSRPMAFSSLEWKPAVWTQTLDAERGIANGEPGAVTIDEPSSMSPSLSADGRYLVYLSNQLGSRSVRVRDLTSGKTITLVASASAFFNPRISGDGGLVAYSDRNGNIFSMPRAGGAVETVCAGCGTTMAVSPDGKRISYGKQ